MGCAAPTSQTNVEPSYGTIAPDFYNQKIDKIAIIVINETRYDLPLRLIEDEFFSKTLQKGYKLASRSDIDNVMKEMKFQQSSLSESDASKIGQFLNVPAVLIVAVTYFAQDTSYNQGNKTVTNRAALGGRLIGVENSEVLWIATEKSDSGDSFKDLWKFDLSKSSVEGILSKLSSNLANKIPPKP